MHLHDNRNALQFSVILQIALHSWSIAFQNALRLSAGANSAAGIAV